jgi:hypothetical protein
MEEGLKAQAKYVAAVDAYAEALRQAEALKSKNRVAACNQGYKLVGSASNMTQLKSTLQGFEILTPVEWKTVEERDNTLSAMRLALISQPSKNPFINDGKACYIERLEPRFPRGPVI